MDTSGSKLVHFFQHSGYFSAQQVDDITHLFVNKEVAKNDLLLREGQVSNEYFFLAEGMLRAFVYDVEGRDVTTNLITPGNIAVEVASFFNRVPSRENIQAMTPVQGWYITYEQLNHLFHAFPEFREFGRSILVKVLTSLKNRTLSMITETAEKRYENLLQSNPAIFQYIPLKYIASYLGITDTSLSRIRKEFTKR
jgi:CRP-like cAMP-binding protein